MGNNKLSYDMKNNVFEILSFWYSIEQFVSNDPFKELKESSSWKEISSWKRDGNPMPWGNFREEADQVYSEYRVYLGVFKKDILSNEFNFDENSKPTDKEKLCFCVMKLNEKGQINDLYNGDFLSLARLPLAIGLLKRDEFRKDNFEEKFTEYLSGVLDYIQGLVTDNETIITYEHILNIQTYMCSASKWNPKCELEISVYGYLKKKNDSFLEEDLNEFLNSSYIDDIRRVMECVAQGDYGNALKQYLSNDVSAEERIDLVSSIENLKSVLNLDDYPLGKWPSDPNHSLSLMQQVAVNLIMRDLKNQNGIFSVNGPPGTGKTTLLRDLIAAIITKRAIKLSEIKDPKSVFSKYMKVEVPCDDGISRTVQTWSLNETLCGSGIVIASSNNKAVENVTKEIPTLSSIDKLFLNENGIDYFRGVALGTVGEEAWGMVAAVLGRKSNRVNFAFDFWINKRNDKNIESDKNSSITMLKYLNSNKKKSNLMERWKKAVREFKDAKICVKNILKEREKFKLDQVSIPEKEDRLSTLYTDIEKTKKLLNELLEKKQYIEKKISESNSEKKILERRLDQQNDYLNKIINSFDKIIDAQKFMSKKKKLDYDFNFFHDMVGNLDAANKSLKKLGEDINSQFSKIQNILQSIGLIEKSLIETPFISKIFNSKRTTQLKNEKNNLRSKLKEVMNDLGKEITRFNTLHETFSKDILVLRELKNENDDIEVNKELIERYKPIEDCGKEINKTQEKISLIEEKINSLNKELKYLEIQISEQNDRISILDKEIDEIMDWKALFEKNKEQVSFLSEERFWELDDEERQKRAPWIDKELNIAQTKLFLKALHLHQTFVEINAGKILNNLEIFIDYLRGKSYVTKYYNNVVQELWETFFLIVPVVSTTFASFGSMFKGMGKESIGWLMIDEAGQAIPQAAVGAIWRAKRAVIIGDPLQIPPIFSVTKNIVDKLREIYKISEAWCPNLRGSESVQVVADRVNRYGTYIDETWVGCPLRVHRRCMEPMFSISNAIAYNGLMIYATKEKDYEMGKSEWKNIIGTKKDGSKFVYEQGEWALKFILKSFGKKYYEQYLSTKGQVLINENDIHFPDIYIITPFREISYRMKKLLKEKIKVSTDYKNWWQWLENSVGTIHTFQGKEADVVILLLGCDKNDAGSISWVASSKNIINVAITRAKYRLYVIGDENLWKDKGDIATVYDMLKED